jgi:hypothetical protein
MDLPHFPTTVNRQSGAERVHAGGCGDAEDVDKG